MAPFLGALSYLNLNLKKISVPILSRRGSSVTVNVRMLFYATLPANSRRTTTNTNKGHHRGRGCEIQEGARCGAGGAWERATQPTASGGAREKGLRRDVLRREGHGLVARIH